MLYCTVWCGVHVLKVVFISMVGKLDNIRTLLSQQSKIIIVDVHLEVHQTIQSHVQLEMPHVCVCVCVLVANS